GETTAKPKVVVALPPRQVMRKTLVLPAAVEENLAQALSYDLDRHTPFRPEQLYYDAAVIDRNPAARTIGVDWVAALKTEMESAREQAEAADGLRTLLERQQGDYNYVLAKKYSYPGAVQIIDDITRLLPDDTWVTQLEMRSTLRGKDTARELTLRGESANAGALISTLEESKLVEQAALQSPTTKLQPGPGEVFVLGARLRNGTAPEPVPVAATAEPATPPALSTPQAAATAPDAAAPATPIPAPNAPAASVGGRS